MTLSKRYVCICICICMHIVFVSVFVNCICSTCQRGSLFPLSSEALKLPPQTWFWLSDNLSSGFLQLFVPIQITHHVTVTHLYPVFEWDEFLEKFQTVWSQNGSKWQGRQSSWPKSHDSIPKKSSGAFGFLLHGSPARSELLAPCFSNTFPPMQSRLNSGVRWASGVLTADCGGEFHPEL